MMAAREWHWDIAIDTTRPALARFAEAVIETRAQVTCAMRLRPSAPMGRGVTALLRVKLREGTEEQFREICRPIHGEMKPPPQVDVGFVVAVPDEMEIPRDDWHPGRKR